jgi:hypothetical protein
MKKRKAGHKFNLECECDACTTVRGTVAYQYDHFKRWKRMMTPVEHRVYDDRDLDQLMTKFEVRDEYRADVRQALVDTAEPGTSELDWILDATLVVGLRRGEIEEPPPGSLGARYLHADEYEATRAS